MLFCDKHFRKEFLQVERWIKFIGIPFFTLMSMLFLQPYPFYFQSRYLTLNFLFSFAGVLGIWLSVRLISFLIRKYLKMCKFLFRLPLQMIITCTTSVIFIFFLHHIGDSVVKDFHDPCECEGHDLKNLIVTVVLLTFLINTIYEGFYLFLRLSETALETEHYKKESIEAQYQNLTSRLNPHFLFNSLNTLTTIVEEDPKKAVAYIQELSVVYRYVLNTQKSTWTDLSSEMKFSQSYILLLKMRFEDNLNIELDLCNKHSNYFILPMTIQLLIENAVKHNEISNNLPLKIQIFCENDYLIVANNKQKRKIMPSTTQFGLQNISDRYNFLVNKDVIIEDLENSFTVKIPLIRVINKETSQPTE